MKLIPVYQRARLHGWTQVDDQDYDDLVQWLWHVSRVGYVYRNLSGGGSELMHRRILGLETGGALHSDHIDGDRLNNTRLNLRAVTQAQNNQNLAPRQGTSRHRGVCWVEGKRRWRAAVCVGGRTVFAGYFHTEDEAAEAADRARREHLPFANPARHQISEEDSSPKEAA